MKLLFELRSEKSRWRQCLAAFASASYLLAHAATAVQAAPAQPEGESGWTPKPGWTTHQFAVAAANPLATEAGYRILKAGGSAIDAAIAVQMVLTLVEPQSSGLGGGAFLLHFNGKKVEAFDGRETAPAKAQEDLFLKPNGTPLSFYEAVVGGRSVGVPGTVSMLAQVHKLYGKLPWAELFKPAIELAQHGFAVSPRLHSLLVSETYLKQDPTAAAYFYDEQGKPREVGYILHNPELAKTLEAVAQQGAKALQQGDIAQAIVDKVHAHPTNPGNLSLADLAGYQPKKREPICVDYAVQMREYRICGMPPPSSGMIAIGQILGILNHTDAGKYALEVGLPSANWLHRYVEASRLAFADRAAYVADPDFVSAPPGGWMSLLTPSYLAARAALIDQSPLGKRMPNVEPGIPSGTKLSYASMSLQVEHGTSQISIVDRYGNAIAMTTTIEDQFGARQMVRGFLLNNELTDFSFIPKDAQGRLIANRVEPGKRPRSSMSPTLVFDKASGNLVMSVGSPGGAQIIHFTAKTLIGVLQWDLAPQAAIDLPNFVVSDGLVLLEANRFQPSTIQALEKRGHTVKTQALTSGLQAVEKTETGYVGGADPRREGVVMGD